MGPCSDYTMSTEGLVCSIYKVPFVCRFHEVEPQRDLHMMAPPQIISQQLLKKNHALIPYPALTEKTLVLAEHAVVGTTDTPDGQLSLMIR